MGEATNFPLSYPGDARPAFAGEAYLKRLGRGLLLANTSRLLTLGTGSGNAPIVFAREFGCTVVAADASETALRSVRERLRGQGVDDRVAVKHVPNYEALPFADAEFDAIYVDPRMPYPLEAAVKRLRRLLAPKGRLCLSYPVRVGRHQNPSVVRFWEQKLGEPLLLPRECLAVCERNGYEPQLIETLEDPGLEAFYREVEQALSAEQDEAIAARVREEIALFRSQGGRSTTSFAVLVVRRKEPGEKPPAARAE